MTTDKIIKKIIGTFKDLQQRASEINSAHQQNVLLTFIRDYIARNVNHIPELDEMKSLVNSSIKSR